MSAINRSLLDPVAAQDADTKAARDAAIAVGVTTAETFATNAVAAEAAARNTAIAAAITTQTLLNAFSTTLATAVATAFTKPGGLAANEACLMVLRLVSTQSGAVGIKGQITAPTGCVLEGFVKGSPGVGAPVNTELTAAINTLWTFSTAAVDGMDIWIRILNGATPGACTFACASGSAGTAVGLKAGSACQWFAAGQVT